MRRASGNTAMNLFLHNLNKPDTVSSTTKMPNGESLSIPLRSAIVALIQVGGMSYSDIYEALNSRVSLNTIKGTWLRVKVSKRDKCPSITNSNVAIEEISKSRYLLLAQKSWQSNPTRTSYSAKNPSWLCDLPMPTRLLGGSLSQSLAR